MQVLADLQLHSRFSRAVSKDMNLVTMSEWGLKKGIDLLATGDWTHPLWFAEIREQLKEVNEGIYEFNKLKYLLATEISSIFSQGGRVRRVHTLVWAPNLEVAEKICKELSKRGCNIASDGRPIVGLSCKQLAQLVWEIDERALVIPAHAWTPWFSVYGAMGGFDSLEEAYGEHKDRIYAIETGLSSDPAMNWRIPELDNKTILSFSDAHSAVKMGREATIFEIPKENYSYQDIYNAVKNESIAYTIEFFPEEGKYHWDGHRACKVIQSPQETKLKGMKCPVCGRNLTVGVMNRVEKLALREEISLKESVDGKGVVWLTHPTEDHRPPFVQTVPLLEIVAEVVQSGVTSKKAKSLYERLVTHFGSEIEVQLRAGVDEIQKIGGERMGQAIVKVRSGDIVIRPGFDGEYGVVKLWSEPQDVDQLGFL